MAELTRRGFFKLLGAAVTLSAGGIALLEQPPVRTYFLPPRGGWGLGTWELACAEEALRVLNQRLSQRQVGDWPCIDTSARIEVVTSWSQYQLDRMLERHARLTERVDKLARGWRGYSATHHTLPNGSVLTVHGRRSRG